jgi:Tfp pilus assembly protein PilV
MPEVIENTNTTVKRKDRGASLIELLMASVLMLIISLGILPLVANAIQTNNRNRLDSTGTMLTTAIIEQVKSTIIGSENSQLNDCVGNAWTVDTAPGGSLLDGSGNIDFTEASPPANYHMNYVVNSPCQTGGSNPMTYDVRWNVAIVGAPANPTNTFLVTVGVRQSGIAASAAHFLARPLNLRVMVGN